MARTRTGSRRNPWLDIPASDYEGHMALDSVRHLQPLAGLFAEVLEEVRPRRVAVPGCTTGSGFESGTTGAWSTTVP